MNIPSRIILDAIAFARTHPAVAHLLAQRDQSNRATIGAIKSKIIDADPELKLVKMILQFDYYAYDETAGLSEDVQVEIEWHASHGYRLVKVEAAQEV